MKNASKPAVDIPAVEILAVDILAIDILAIEVCRAIRDVGRDHQDGISLDRLQERLGFASRSAIDAAVAFAAAKGWVAIGGAPAYSVLLTQDAPPGRAPGRGLTRGT